MNQRSAQEILGHSDANLTAEAYTDVASLQLHDEIAKLPWISCGAVVAQPGAQSSGVSSPSASLADLCAKLVGAIKAAGAQNVSHLVASAVTSLLSSEISAGACSRSRIPLGH